MNTDTKTADADAAVDARAIEAVPDAIDSACGHFGGRTQALLATHNLDGDQRWYDLADYVALYEELLGSTGEHTVRRVGKELAHALTWESNVDSAPAALAALDDVYDRLHRGAAGGYEFERTGPESGRLVCDTPYPEAFHRGLLRGLGQRFTDTGFLKAEVTDAGRDRTTFELHWWSTVGSDASAGGPTATGDAPVGAD
jgi:hypothetical protein